jgi:hypothetical protein
MHEQNTAVEHVAVEALLEYEAQTMGCPVTLIDHAELAYGVSVIVYDQQPSRQGDMGTMHTRRVACYVGAQQKWSSIVSTWWDRSKPPSAHEAEMVDAAFALPQIPAPIKETT